jgi:excinuclease ABC subunit C
MSSDVDEILGALPDQPGVYQFFDKEDKVIYIGKAKSLQKRVRSYFSKPIHDSAKTNVLVRKIENIKTILVETEFDALLLENSLIKKYKPRYNVLLKDDKTYPWICIKKEPFPRVFSTRKVIRDGSEYFGPYASGKVMVTVLDLIRQLYPLRNCHYDLSPENIQKGKLRACLEFQIGNCNAPCEARETEDMYDIYIRETRELLKGNFAQINRSLKEGIKSFAEKLEFEKAQDLKEKLDVLEQFQSKSTVVNPSIHNVDVFYVIFRSSEQPCH